MLIKAFVFTAGSFRKMSPPARLVHIFVTFLVSSYIAQPAADQDAQQDNVTLPVMYSAKVVPEGDATCPSSEEHVILAEIGQEVRTLIQEAVLPTIQCPGINSQKPAMSCLQIAECDPEIPSGYYWIGTNATQVHCDMDTEGCGGAHGWTRVAFLNLTDPEQTCPSAWTQVTSPVRACGKTTDGAGCDSVIFNTHGIPYEHVLGRITGRSLATPDAFCIGYHNRDLEFYYLDGMSITHGTPREHIWSFGMANPGSNCCPCDQGTFGSSPSFVGNDYFCDGFVSTGPDPLWDGEGCDSSQCCTHNDPPWFCKQLPQATTDDIEIRICSDEHLSNENIFTELIEVYVR